MDGEPTEQNTFRTRLMDILFREYGRCNISRYDDVKIGIDTNDGEVNTWIYDDYALLICKLKDPKGKTVTIPTDDIAEYVPILAGLCINPAIYLSSNGENYVPHFNFILHESDTEDPGAVIMAVDKLAFMADVASKSWNDAVSGHGPESGEGSAEE